VWDQGKKGEITAIVVGIFGGNLALMINWMEVKTLGVRPHD